MKAFMDADFLLSTPTAQKLYHDHAAQMPIVDYHCHIDPRMIAEDYHFADITEVWLGGDHYKWRLMRSHGVPERLITGDAPSRDKFQAWAETLSRAIGNPLYHWSMLELKRYFGYEGVLNVDTAEDVWQLCNEKLKTLSVRQMILEAGVQVICTTDDPVDDLRWHQQIAADDTFSVKVLPAWRPDKATNIEKPEFLQYIAQLARVSGVDIQSFSDLKTAIRARMDYFAANGCSVSDHGVDVVPYFVEPEWDPEEIFDRALNGEALTKEDVLAYKTAFLLFLGEEYARRNWVMQLHFGAKRNNNTPMFRKLGPDTGYDTIGDQASVADMSDFLDALNSRGLLPKTILYSLNPNDNAAIVSVIGAFQDDTAVCKVQHGSAWWFNDNKVGMTEQLTNLANLGMLGDFVGMLTDSRSFLSYTRHEYFRRILCELLGSWVENGEYPWDEKTLGALVEDIAFNNAMRYFHF